LGCYNIPLKLMLVSLMCWLGNYGVDVSWILWVCQQFEQMYVIRAGIEHRVLYRSLLHHLNCSSSPSHSLLRGVFFLHTHLADPNSSHRDPPTSRKFDYFLAELWKSKYWNNFLGHYSYPSIPKTRKSH
jgi:hypothetical protein